MHGQIRKHKIHNELMQESSIWGKEILKIIQTIEI